MVHMSPVQDVSDTLRDLRARRAQVAEDVQAARAAGEVKAYIALLPQLYLLEDALEKAERKHIRLSREGSTHPSWQIRRDQLEQQFLDAYGNRGPQYQILVKHLVAAEIRFEQAEASGRDIDIDEFRKIMKAAAEAISALQRYTESTKIDHTEGRNEGIQVVLRVVEEIVAPAYPELYAHIVDTLVERARGGRGALSGARKETGADPVC